MSCRTSDDTVISVDYVEWSGVAWVESWYVIGGCGMVFFWKADHFAVVVVVWVHVCRVVVGLVEGGLKVFLGKCICDVK